VGYVETKHRDHDKKQGGKGVRFSSSSSAYECHRESRKVNGKTWTSCLKVTVEVKDVEKEMKQGKKEEKEKREKREKKEKKEKKEKREKREKKEKETKENRR